MQPRIDPSSRGHEDLDRYTRAGTKVVDNILKVATDGSVTTSSIYVEIAAERARQTACAHGGDTAAFDKQNTPNDWVALVTAYLGRATQKCARNTRENQEYRPNLIKAAAIIVAAIEANDACSSGS